MMNGRTIKVFLAKGVPEGLRTAEIMNWTGKMLVFPQSQLADFVQRQEANRTGIYVLIGDDLNDPTKKQIYIGESDNISTRLQQHAKDASKDYWEHTIVVTSKDENLSKAHVRYLENRLISLAKQAKQAVIANGNSGAPVTLSESDSADMEFFLSQIQMLLPVLGYSFTQTLPAPAPAVVTGASAPAASNGTSPTPAGTAAPVNTLTSPPLVLAVGSHSASAYETSGVFIVKAGSLAQASATTALGNTYRQKRDALRQIGTFVDAAQPGYWELVEDTGFNSPSAAAAIMLGYNANGRTLWKVEGSGITYKDWQNNQVFASASLTLNALTSSATGVVSPGPSDASLGALTADADLLTE